MRSRARIYGRHHKISGLTGGPSYCQPGGAVRTPASLLRLSCLAAPLLQQGGNIRLSQPWHSGEHSGLSVQVNKILFPIFAVVGDIRARSYATGQQSHSVMTLLM